VPTAEPPGTACRGPPSTGERTGRARRYGRTVPRPALDAHAEARLDGLRAALAVLAFACALALFLTSRVPATQPRSA